MMTNEYSEVTDPEELLKIYNDKHGNAIGRTLTRRYNLMMAGDDTDSITGLCMQLDAMLRLLLQRHVLPSMTAPDPNEPIH